MEKKPVVPKSLLIPFVLITSCFALWGFANDVTNPMVKAFSKIFLMSNFQGSLVQLAFYGGYFAMAIPAAIFIKKFSYKSGILMGLALYAIGGLLFVPASWTGQFTPFLVAYFVLTCGLSFLETSANPYILSMGPEETATQRLNLAQSFNPMGSLVGMFAASQFILAGLDGSDYATRQAMPAEQFEAVKMADLGVVRGPYVAIGLVILAAFVLIALVKMPKNQDADSSINMRSSYRRLFKIPHYREGVVAQMFYVGAQIMCWTFIIQYGTEVFVARGMGEQAAEVLSQKYNIAAMIIFGVSRFICTFLLKYIRPGALLMYLAIGAAVLISGVIFFGGMAGLYCLVGVSACMSLMFPTIYGIALKGTGDDAKFAAAGLVMAILGGSIMPPLQGHLIDIWNVSASFILPLICFVAIAVFGLRVMRVHRA
ncbi:MAG: L-fucose:H+ symporter permease [Saprospiraceae bacterium]|nr:MAG: L-fucose:H+ symporter permease [Saprospiraceae bacterium]